MADGVEDLAVVELAGGERALDPGQTEAVLASLRRHGAAVVAGAVDPDRCDALRAAMLAELDDAAARPAALDVPGHVQHNPPPRAEHLDPEVFANPVAVAIARALLGDGVQLGLYTGNTMLGGTSRAQPVHWDEPQLWGGLAEAPPAATLTVNIPLVDVTVDNGALEVWPGTHLDVRSGDRRGRGDGLLVPDDWLDARRAEVPPVRVPMPKGALLLRDGRLWHRGTTNSTADARPMVALELLASWLRPLPIDFYADAEPIVRAAGVPVMARYRESFDHLAWPPTWSLAPKPLP